MGQSGLQADSELAWWWKVAQHLDEAQLALSNAMAHNVDDPRPVQALYGRLREGQAILFDIFRLKGLLPAFPAVAASTPKMPGVPGHGVPGSNEAAGAPPHVEEHGPLIAHDASAVPAEGSALSASAPIMTESIEVPPSATADSNTEGAGG